MHNETWKKTEVILDEYSMPIIYITSVHENRMEEVVCKILADDKASLSRIRKLGKTIKAVPQMLDLLRKIRNIKSSGGIIHEFIVEAIFKLLEELEQ